METDTGGAVLKGGHRPAGEERSLHPGLGGTPNYKSWVKVPDILP